MSRSGPKRLRFHFSTVLQTLCVVNNSQLALAIQLPWKVHLSAPLPGEVLYLVGGDWFVVALERIDGFGVAQSSPLVPLDRVSLCQHFQLLCDALVVIFLLGVGRLGTNPLAGRLGHHVRAITDLL